MKVAVRTRPMNSKESKRDESSVIRQSDTNSNQIIAERARGQSKTFNYDHVFWTTSTQEEIYRSMAAPLVESLLQAKS